VHNVDNTAHSDAHLWERMSAMCTSLIPPLSSRLTTPSEPWGICPLSELKVKNWAPTNSVILVITVRIVSHTGARAHGPDSSAHSSTFLSYSPFYTFLRGSDNKAQDPRGNTGVSQHYSPLFHRYSPLFLLFLLKISLFYRLFLTFGT